MRNKIVASYLALAAAFCCAAPLGYCQGVDTVVEVPTTARTSPTVQVPNATTNTDPGMSMAGESKSVKNVVEETEKPSFWNWDIDVGYYSEYNFRGTNLLPNSGAVFGNAEVHKWGFNLGMFVIGQTGRAHANAWSLGESGGSGQSGIANPGLPGGALVFNPTTVQNSFVEIDAFLSYTLSLNWVDITAGNIAFFITRDARTEFAVIVNGTPIPGFQHIPADTVGDEQFDRLFLNVSSSKIPFVKPSVTYYQTIFNDGQNPQVFTTFGRLIGIGAVGPRLRNESLGGYLEGRLSSNIPIGNRVSVKPFGAISYSFHDRTEPIANPTTFRDGIRGRSLVGWNAVQAGIEVPILLFHQVAHTAMPGYAPEEVSLYLTPSGYYSHHIADPTPGTERDEGWYGAKLTLTF
jgi:hypothetical protein